MSQENDFLKKLLATFKVEAAEHIRNISSGITELEKPCPSEKRVQIIETIFREAHSLKGSARAVNVTDIEKVCQSLENVFSMMKRGERSLPLELLDALHRVVDNVGKLLPSVERERTAGERTMLAESARLLDCVLKGTLPPLRKQETDRVDDKEAAPIAEKALDTVRIPVTRLESLMLKTEELLSAKLAGGELYGTLKELGAFISDWEQNWKKVYPEVRIWRRSLETLGATDKTLSHLFDFLDWNQDFTKSLKNRLAALTAATQQNQSFLSGMVDSIIQDMKQSLMLPCASITEVLPGLVRDISREQGKSVELVIQGQEIEIDRRILEEMKEPLIHLARNSIDHGIERPDEREKKGKPARGKITITISQKDSAHAELCISDDGVGVNTTGVRAAAVKRGAITQAEADSMGEEDVIRLIFLSGVSTSPIITNVSGRGLGLTIVQEKVEKLGGTVFIETALGTGTTFRILLPITLATFRGILVQSGGLSFVVPTAKVEQVLRVKNEDIKTVENTPTIQLDSRAVSLVSLARALGISGDGLKHGDSGFVRAFVLGSAEKRIAFSVDEIISEQEVLVKPLGNQLSHLTNISGATVLPSGEVVPVVNTVDLIKSALKVAALPVKLPVAIKEQQAERKAILVVEDSITTRTLLRNILESAGYSVKTAVDGIDAFSTLRTQEFDLVVSDIDMPRMNGFDLTARIRSDKRLAELPVVLVTALESREDRERGIDVGADAYIVKSSFDQSNLLETIGRLI